MQRDWPIWLGADSVLSSSLTFPSSPANQHLPTSFSRLDPYQPKNISAHATGRGLVWLPARSQHSGNEDEDENQAGGIGDGGFIPR